MQHYLVVLLALAQIGSLLVLSHPTNPVTVEPQTEMHQRPRLDLKSEPEEPGEQRETGVSPWNFNEQGLKWDELTRCIRGSESENAIERWSDCLESLEESNPASAPSALKPLQTMVGSKIASGDAEVKGPNLDPSSAGSAIAAGKKNWGSFVGNSDVREGLGFPRIEDSTARLADENQNLKAAAAVSEDPPSGTGSGASDSGRSGRGNDRKGSSISLEMEVSENSEMPTSLEERRLSGEDDTRGASDVRRSGLKFGTDTSSEITGDLRSLQISVCNMDAGFLEPPAEAMSSTASTKGPQNLLDALKLAACLGAAVTLIWRKKDRLLASGKETQSILSEQVVEYPCPSGPGFSMNGLSSSSTNIGYLNVKAGSLSSPLGMAIATVMAESLEQEHSQRAPRTADDLSKLLEAAMTESLSQVLGSECSEFVEQFKQSFRSTYRLLVSVRIAAGRNSVAPSYPNHIRDFSQPRRFEGPSTRHYRRADDEEDNLSGVTSVSRGANLDPVFEFESRIPSHAGPDSGDDLVEQLNKLTFSTKSPKTTAKRTHIGTVLVEDGAMKTSCDGGNSSPFDQDVLGGFGEVSSSLRDGDTSQELSENGTDHSGFQVHQNGVRNRWGRGSEQPANGRRAEGEVAQLASHQARSSLESSGQDLAIQPFGCTSSPGQLVVASESGLSNYQQRKLLQAAEEMRLKKVELQLRYHEFKVNEAAMGLASENNTLVRENLDLSRNKVEMKEAEVQDRKLTAAHSVLAKRCADNMVAGLCVMLCALFFGAWKYSYDRLVDEVSACQPTLYEPSNSFVPGFNTVVNSLNHMTSRLHMFACEVTVASRMFFGLGIICCVAALLLRKSVGSSSQAMPATVLVVVLGGICGGAGKVAVDSMGGSGVHWLLMWEAFCLVHTLATCFTSTLHRILNGPADPHSLSTATSKYDSQQCRTYVMKPWLRRLLFHGVTVLVLPILAGLLPFAHVLEIVQVLGFHLWNVAYSPLEEYLRRHYLESSGLNLEFGGGSSTAV